MTTQLTVTLDKNYIVSNEDGSTYTRLTSFAKLIDFLTSKEFDTLTVEFNLPGIEKLDKRAQKNYLKRIDNLGNAFGMKVAFIENKVFGGQVFPLHFIGSLITPFQS